MSRKSRQLAKARYRRRGRFSDTLKQAEALLDYARPILRKKGYMIEVSDVRLKNGSTATTMPVWTIRTSNRNPKLRDMVARFWPTSGSWWIPNREDDKPTSGTLEIGKRAFVDLLPDLRNKS